MKRTDARHISESLKDFVKDQNFGQGVLLGRVFLAWDEVVAEVTAGVYPRSQSSRLTVSRFFRDGELCCRMASSMLRTQFKMNEAMLLRRLQSKLPENTLKKLTIR